MGDIVVEISDRPVAASRQIGEILLSRFFSLLKVCVTPVFARVRRLNRISDFDAV